MFDPVAMDDTRAVFGENISYAKATCECVKNADAVVIVTEWNEFRNPGLPKIKKLLKTPFFFDLRNIYEPDTMEKQGFRYFCVGRP